MLARIGVMRALNRGHVREFKENGKQHHWGGASSKQVGDVDHSKVFATADAAEKWFQENDPEGVAFEYEVLE